MLNSDGHLNKHIQDETIKIPSIYKGIIIRDDNAFMGFSSR